VTDFAVANRDVIPN